MKDDELDKLLKNSSLNLPDEPGFRREVWKRIEADSEKVSLKQLVNEALEYVTRPAVGLPLTALVIAFSVWLAVENGTSQREEIWTDLASIYHGSISPLNHSE